MLATAAELLSLSAAELAALGLFLLPLGLPLLFGIMVSASGLPSASASKASELLSALKSSPDARRKCVRLFARTQLAVAEV